MTNALNIRVRQYRGYVLITVAGEVDIAAVAQLRECLAAVAPGGLPLVVDLDEVTFLDATGLGALVGGANRATAHGASLHVVCSQRQTRNLLHLTGLERRLGLCRTLADALTAISLTRTGRRRGAGGTQVPATLAEVA